MKYIGFDSNIISGRHNFEIASGFNSTTQITFSKENIEAIIEASGSVDFCDLENKVLASAEVPPQQGGRRRYMDVNCQVKDDSIIIEFPVYAWTDNYPNCDGEYDRWDYSTVGYHTVIFDLKTNAVNVIKRS